MADLIWRNALLLGKKETTEGTANAPGAGDAILCTGLQPTLQRDFHERTYHGGFGTRAGVIGAQTGAGLSFQTEIKGNGSNNTPEIDELLESVFGQVASGTGDTTVGNGSTTTSVVVASSTNFTAGNLVMIETSSTSDEYEVAMITDVPNGTTLTVSPALSFTPANGAAVKEMRTYQLLYSGHPSMTFDVFYSVAGGGADQYDRFVGCHGNLSFASPGAGQVPMLTWDWQAWNWTQATNGTRPTPTYDTATPQSALGSKFKVDGTLVDVFDVNWSLNNEIARKLSQNSTLGVYGTPIVNHKPSGSFKIHPAHTSIAQFTGWTAGTEVSLIQQLGKSLNGTVAWYCPKAQRSSVGRGDDNGVQALEINFNANMQDDGLATAVDAAIYLAVG